MFRDRVIVIENLSREYILGWVLHRDNRFGMGYSTDGRHYITLNGERLEQNCSQLTTNSILKTKGKIKLLPSSISIIEVRTLEILDPNNIYYLDFDTFQLPKGNIPLDTMNHMDHKTPQILKIPILNTNYTVSNLGKNSPVAILVPAGKCKQCPAGQVVRSYSGIRSTLEP